MPTETTNLPAIRNTENLLERASELDPEACSKMPTETTDLTDREIGEKIIDVFDDAYRDADLQAAVGALFGLNTEAEKNRVCSAVARAAREVLKVPHAD